MANAYVRFCMLMLKSFRKSFGDHTVLDIASINLEPGIHWVKGRNGSGKTTLFNCLAGLSPYMGSITISGIDLGQEPGAYKLLVNYSQSEPVFPEFLTGRELIDFFSDLKKAPEGQADQLCQLLGVDEFAHKPCGSYSSGMTKKLSITLAFLGTPKLIILDEPLITLDKEAQEVVTELIADQFTKGASFIFATHQDFENELIRATCIYEVKDQSLKPVP